MNTFQDIKTYSEGQKSGMTENMFIFYFSNTFYKFKFITNSSNLYFSASLMAIWPSVQHSHDHKVTYLISDLNVNISSSFYGMKCL